MQDFARASALTGYGDIARELGLDPASMLATADLPNDILAHPDGLVSYRRFLALLNLSAEQSGDRFFGLKLGLHQGVTIFGPLLYLIRNADTVGDALTELRQYFHLHMGAAQLEIEQFKGSVQLAYRVFDPLQPGISQGIELAMGVGYRLLKTLLGSQWQPQAILIEHSPHSPPGEYRRFLGITPQFQAHTSALLMDAANLAAPLTDADPELHKLIRAHLDNLQQLSNQELPGYVSSLLKNLLPQGRVTVDQVAECMTMSRRTLQRRLAERHSSFQAVLDQTRQDMARRYLNDSSLQMTQLADLLGYADLSAFSRAFSRWFGVPPSRWRMTTERPPDEP